MLGSAKTNWPLLTLTSWVKGTSSFGPKLAFLVIWARPCWLIWCPISGLDGGCGARAVSRKTPIYFITITTFGQFSLSRQNRNGSSVKKLRYCNLSIVILRELRTSFLVSLGNWIKRWGTFLLYAQEFPVCYVDLSVTLILDLAISTYNSNSQRRLGNSRFNGWTVPTLVFTNARWYYPFLINQFQTFSTTCYYVRM